MQVSVKSKSTRFTFSITCTQIGSGERDERKFRAAEKDCRISIVFWEMASRTEPQGQTKEKLRVQNKPALIYYQQREKEKNRQRAKRVQERKSCTLCNIYCIKHTILKKHENEYIKQCTVHYILWHTWVKLFSISSCLSTVWLWVT